MSQQEDIVKLQALLKSTISLLFHKKEAIENLNNISEHIAHLENEILVKENFINNSKIQIEGLSQHLLEKQENIEQLQAELNIFSQERSKKEEERKKLDAEIKDHKLRQNLIAKLLSAKNNHSAIREYYRLLEGEFIPFINTLAVLPDKVNIIFELQEIGQELKMISANPAFYQKRTIAVSGGFSAGKSAFISSLFHQKKGEKRFHLAIDVTPTTAIPTYVLNSDKKSFLACNNNGGIINLLEDETGKENFANIKKFTTHQFLDSFGFKLQQLMPFIFLSTPMKYEQLCFIDTPGYNPGSQEMTNDDGRIAKEFIGNSEALIWVIDCTNGTISQTDLEFLESVLIPEKMIPLFIVLNKADLKPEDELKDIMEVVKEELEDYEIPFKGISAYNSNCGKELDFIKLSLNDFLTEFDTKNDNQHKEIKERLNKVKDKYTKALTEKYNHHRKIFGELNKIETLTIGMNFEDYDEEQEVISTLQDLKKSFKDYENFKKFSNKIEEIMHQMEIVIDYIFCSSSENNNHTLK
ncbi:dynamin family protein [Avibacterium paragallinarum]|uniref:dynamin family protein n=2 Tax=Avibacterium paragallinarum TaxID=728 RepID=UPI00021AD55F|nr:dynamin family protein [Avibacterium paragallinarum]AZI13949.1 hypothetical protein EIA51_04525 [Avibacterium paragallinarum]QIR11413.1 hypothetical protein HBL79_03665 [Avibacterium paragallinarum]QJE09614.1 hypothetical protein HHJ62_04480 [Avibacterium paragallinarum]QJE11810.1 hypothetical protein HHJ61_04485 [Avibacterium paragallinarum]QJE14009.1 hypothetical protein HHJ60_04495 [Avibacterium paragallinarum]